MNQHLISLVRRSYASILDLAHFLDHRGYWTGNHTIVEDTSHAIFHLFENVAWSDGKLHHNECWMLGVLIEADRERNGSLSQLVSLRNPNHPTQGEDKVPGVLVAAALYDSIHHTRFAEMLANQLENLALLLMMCDSKVKPKESLALQRYSEKLRAVVPPVVEPMDELLHPIEFASL